jgi:hypothetical protein
MIIVYFESGAHSEIVARFDGETLYNACLPELEKVAALNGMIVTDSVVEESIGQKTVKELTEELVQEHDKLNDILDSASKNINDLCKTHKDELGLVSDEFRATNEYKKARQQFKTAWNNMRAFNHRHRKNMELSDFMYTRIMARRIAKRDGNKTS